MMGCREMCAQESRIPMGKAPHRRAEGIRPLPQMVLCSLLSCCSTAGCGIRFTQLIARVGGNLFLNSMLLLLKFEALTKVNDLNIHKTIDVGIDVCCPMPAKQE